MRINMAQKSKALSRNSSTRTQAALQKKTLSLSAAKELVKLDYDIQHKLDKPVSTSFGAVVVRCRALEKESDFLKLYLPLKRAVFNYGLQIKPANVKGKKPTEQDVEKLEEWLDEPTSVKFDPVVVVGEPEPVEVELILTNRDMLLKFIDDSWNEHFLLDNLVVTWLDNQGFGSVIPPEKTQFIDTLGIPILRYTHGLSAADILKLPADLQERYRAKSSIVLNPKYGEHFKVLKTARDGDGYGVPSLYSIFNLLSEVISKQEGMNAMAYMCRSVRRVHKLGHEIKSGDRAGKPTHFWDPVRAKATLDSWDKKVGASDWTTNFDWDVAFPWPDLKVFDEIAFKGSNARLNAWGGPLMTMLQAKGVMPYIPNMLRAMANSDRGRFGPFMAITINNAWEPPVPVTLDWSDMIFNEARLTAELIKFAQQSGWISVETARETMGLNDINETARKVGEATNSDASKAYLPIWDAAHGISPALGETAVTLKTAGQKPGSKNGKPAGSTDNS
jgi:hypothetical protein